ncbi:hypothetical protein HOI26_05240 [Candidatus Woesearchaeota archaeon]|nr:hypothetical protein [Candidatus Woesearchaeota archaeon]MBT5740471.1 hypothetical protein [Candidatus Woesearchaeota archaeon]
MTFAFPIQDYETPELISGFCEAYGALAHPIYMALKSESRIQEKFDEDMAVRNITGLFLNPSVQEMVKRARETVFSRRDKKSSVKRFSEFVFVVAKEVAKSYSNEVDFSSITRLPEMISRTHNFTRKQKPIGPTLIPNRGFLGKPATSVSKDIRSGMRMISCELADRLYDAEMSINLLGSVRYGDANESSDIDIDFLVTSRDKRLQKIRRNLAYVIEEAIDETFELKHQVREEAQFIDLSQYYGLFFDIKEGANTCMEDYAYDLQWGGRDLFHPYNWLLEGETLPDIPGKYDILTGEAQCARQEMFKVASQDPLFEFLICYKLHGTIEKRKKLLDRI